MPLDLCVVSKSMTGRTIKHTSAVALAKDDDAALPVSFSPPDTTRGLIALELTLRVSNDPSRYADDTICNEADAPALENNAASWSASSSSSSSSVALDRPKKITLRGVPWTSIAGDPAASYAAMTGHQAVAKFASSHILPKLRARLFLEDHVTEVEPTTNSSRSSYAQGGGLDAVSSLGRESWLEPMPRCLLNYVSCSLSTSFEVLTLYFELANYSPAVKKLNRFGLPSAGVADQLSIRISGSSSCRSLLGAASVFSPPIKVSVPLEEEPPRNKSDKRQSTAISSTPTTFAERSLFDHAIGKAGGEREKGNSSKRANQPPRPQTARLGAPMVAAENPRRNIRELGEDSGCVSAESSRQETNSALLISPQCLSPLTLYDHMVTNGASYSPVMSSKTRSSDENEETVRGGPTFQRSGRGSRRPPPPVRSVHNGLRDDEEEGSATIRAELETINDGGSSGSSRSSEDSCQQKRVKRPARPSPLSSSVMSFSVPLVSASNSTLLAATSYDAQHSFPSPPTFPLLSSRTSFSDECDSFKEKREAGSAWWQQPPQPNNEHGDTFSLAWVDRLPPNYVHSGDPRTRTLGHSSPPEGGAATSYYEDVRLTQHLCFQPIPLYPGAAPPFSSATATASLYPTSPPFSAVRVVNFTAPLTAIFQPLGSNRLLQSSSPSYFASDGAADLKRVIVSPEDGCCTHCQVVGCGVGGGIAKGGSEGRGGDESRPPPPWSPPWCSHDSHKESCYAVELLQRFLNERATSNVSVTVGVDQDAGSDENWLEGFGSPGERFEDVFSGMREEFCAGTMK